MGKTKIFIRHPETLFFLEECIERKDYECATRISKAWKKWTLAKRALEQRARAANIFRGKKERRQDSINRQFTGDYMNYDDNYQLQDIINKSSRQEAILFTDQVIKLNRRNNPERRDFVLTDQAVYIVMRAQQNGQVFYKLNRRTAIADIQSLSLSTMADDYLCMNIPKEYDNLIENSKKTEITAILMEAYQKLTGRQLTINFTDNIQMKIKSGDQRTIVFQKNESCQQPQLKKQGRTLTVMIKTGLDRNTDSTPANMSYGGGGGGGAKRGGGGARGGARGGAQKTATPAQSTPSTRGASRGGGSALPKPPPKKGPQSKALYAYDAQTQDELSFREGEMLTVLKKDPQGWWECQNDSGQKGWCPANYFG